MNIKGLKYLNGSQTIDKALHAENLEHLTRAAWIRRAVYLAMFFLSFSMIPVCAITEQMSATITSVFLTTISLVIVTKYDIHIQFLRIIKADHIKRDQVAEELHIPRQ